MVSFIVVSLFMVVSLIMVVESLIIAAVSVAVTDDAVDSVFVLEQAVASAITDRKKNADFFMVVLN